MKKILVVLILLMLYGCKEVKSASLQSAMSTMITQEKIEEAKWAVLENNRVKLLQELKEVNEDFVGIVRVGSLIEENVVHSSDNNDYLRLDFEKNYYRKGTIFMDYRNTLDDQNIILYGHYVYYDETSMFSPLHELKDENNYESQKYIELELIEGIRKYQVAAVFYYDLDLDKPQYYHTSYDRLLSGYLKDVKNAQFYDSGVKITEKSKLLTLQTCVRNRDDLRLIVVAVEVER